MRGKTYLVWPCKHVSFNRSSYSTMMFYILDYTIPTYPIRDKRNGPN